jgi:hypothetical protein
MDLTRGADLETFECLPMSYARASDSYLEAVARFQKIQAEVCEPFVNMSHTL